MRRPGIKEEIEQFMKTFASALIGLSFVVGTMLAQTPSTSTTPGSTSTTTKTHKHKKHHNSTSGSTSQSSTSSTPSK